MKISIKQFFRSSFVRLLFFSFLALSLILLSSGIIIGVVGVEQARQKVMDSYDMALMTVANALQDQLSDVEALASISLLEDDLMRLCINHADIANLYDYVTFGNDLKLRVNNRTLEIRLSILMPDENWVISTYYGVRKQEQIGIDDAYWKQLAQSSQWHIVTSLQYPYSPDNQDKSLMISVGYLRKMQKSPIAIIEITEKSLMENLRQATSDLNVVSIFLQDQNGQTIQTGERLDPSAILLNTEMITTLQGKNYPCALLRTSDYTLGVLFDDSLLLQPVVRMQQWMIALFSVCILACIFFMGLSYCRVIRPVEALVHGMDRVGCGDFSARVVCQQQDEFGRLARHYNRMLEQIQHLIKEQYIRQLDLQKAQLRFLRLQIRPHFLYNCLFSLYTMIMNEDLNNAAKMSVYLGKYYQMCTRVEESEIPLSQELENVRMYICINQMRFSEKLMYRADVPDNLLSCPIPALLLLTLVENVINHGLKNPMESISIQITGTITDEGMICLQVADTGRGMEENIRKRVILQLESKEFDENAHGLVNACLRLRMVYGEKAQLQLQNNMPSGTIVTLLIPTEKAEGEKHV